jgi:hypothetical protein
MTHSFQPSQKVRLIHGFPYRNAADGAYEIIRQLPYAEGEHQYRIKSPNEQYDRVVK